MRLVLLGGAPGVGKSTVAAALLEEVMYGDVLVQWVDVDALWRHQPWRVDDRTKSMVQANLRAVMANAAEAGVEVLVVTWVFQDAAMQDLVRGLAPAGARIETVQLLVDESEWRDRWASDPLRPPISDFFVGRHAGAQATPADVRMDTSALDAAETARALATALGL